jgi:hypothetical protein
MNEAGAQRMELVALEEFNVEFPEIPEVDDDQLSLDEYFEQVRKAIVGEKRWELFRSLSETQSAMS